SIDDHATLESLEVLSGFYGGDAASNTASSRRGLRGDIEARASACNRRFLDAFSDVMGKLSELEGEIGAIQDYCTEMDFKLKKANDETASLVKQTQALKNSSGRSKALKAIVEVFLDRFTPSDAEVQLLVSATAPVDNNFFRALKHLQDIQEDCKALLITEHQRTGLDILELVTSCQEQAFDKLFRWVQLELRSMNKDLPEVTLAMRLAMRALKLRPSMFQPIEMHAHDPLRYVGDMLAWLHQAAVSEREFLESLFSPNDKTEEAGLKLGPNHAEDLDQFIYNILDKNLERTCRPLKVRVEDVLNSQLDIILSYKIANMIEFYWSTISHVAGKSSQLAQALGELTENGFKVFGDALQAQSSSLETVIKTPNADLIPPAVVRQAVDQLKELMSSYDASLIKYAEKEADFSRILSAVLDPLVKFCGTGTEQLTRLENTIYVINCLHHIQMALHLYTFTASWIKDIETKIESQMQILEEELYLTMLDQSGLAPLIMGMDKTTDKTLPLSLVPELDERNIGETVSKMNVFLCTAGFDAAARVSRLTSSRRLRECLEGAVRRFLGSYQRLYDAVMDPKNRYEFPASLMSRTVEEIETLLEMTTDTTNASSSSESTHSLFIRALLLLSMILVSMNINGLLHKLKFHYLSESAVTIILGLIVAVGWTAISYDETNADIQLSSNFFYMVLLPPIIFEGGYTLQRVSFFSNFFTIFALAFVGALFSTFVCSALMYFFSMAVYPWSFVESLVFGSLISSTDPVTVLSLLPSNVDRRLYMLIFGESALNDAVAIILYRFFTGLADPSTTLGAGPFLLSVVQSAGVFFGSFIIGVLIGLLFAKITKHVEIGENSTVYEMTMLLIFAYSSYLLADVLQLTGIISIFFCGITMAHYAQGNLSSDARKQSRTTLRVLAFMCECFIFLYLGLGLLSFGGKTTYDISMIFFAIISILVSRCHVFIVLGIKNLIVKKDAPIPIQQQVLIWFSGLRGAVAFALGVTFLENDTFSEEIKGYIFGTTVMVVVFTILVFGGLTPYMLVWLGIIDKNAAGHGHGGDQQQQLLDGAEGQTKDGAATSDKLHDAQNGPESGSLQGSKNLASGSVNSLLQYEEDQRVQQQEAESKPVFSWLNYIDNTYIRPHFSKNVTVPQTDTLVTNSLFPTEVTVRREDVRPSVTHRQSVAASLAARKSLTTTADDEDLEVLVQKSSYVVE
ncbi:Golgi transport complex subunit 6, partial [Cladochytrium tenue]